MKTTLDTGVVVRHNQSGVIKVYSPILDEESIYNEVTLDTALRNELEDQLIKLHK
jgi:hypothetical protein